MTNPEGEKPELTPESAAAIAELAEGQRTWILKHIEEAGASDEAKRKADSVRLRVNKLLKTAEFLEKLSKTRDLQEMDNLLEFDLREELHGLEKEFDFKSFPNYEKIVTDALMYCLTQTDEHRLTRKTWIRDAITIRTVLGRDMTFDDSKIPGYTDAWKSVFVYAVDDNQDLAISIANVTHGEVNLREIPNYEQLIKDRYYRVMLTCYKREDHVLKDTLGNGINFAEKEQKIADKMNECLNDVHNYNVIDILYILNKFDVQHFGPDNIENFEQGVKTAFLFCLQNGNLGVESARIIKVRLGSGVNFDNEVRAGIAHNLNQFKDHEDHWLKRALDIKEILGEDVDLHADTECQQAVVGVCMRLLQSTVWRPEYIVSMKEQLGEGIEFSEETVQGYEKVIQEAFLRELREKDPSDAKMIQDEFGQGIQLDAENLKGYKAAVRDGFTGLVNNVSIQRAKHLTDQFEEGAEIKDKATIVQRKFIDLLNDNEWQKAIEIKEGFEPEIMCDREHIAKYDDSFRACLYYRFTQPRRRDATKIRMLHEKLGEGVNITDTLRKIKENNVGGFIAFSNRDHWRAVFGDEAVDKFLAALPKNTDEKRNAFTHNSYDRTTSFMEFLSYAGDLHLDDESFALITDFVKRFGLSRSQNLYQYFYSLSKLQEGEPIPEMIAEGGITSIDDLEARVKDLRQKVYGEEPVTNLSNLSSIELELLAVITGKSTHRFDYGRPGIEKIAGDFESAYKDGEIAEVPEGYGVESIETSAVSIDFDVEAVRDDYTILKREITEGAQQPENVNPLLEQSLRIVDEKLATLKNKGTNKFVLDQISKAEALRARIAAVQDLDALMSVLTETKFMGKKNPFYPIMRQIVFRKIFIKNRSPEVVADMLARLSGEEITGQNVLEVIGIVDNTVKDHVLNLNGDNKEKYWREDTWKSLLATQNDSKLVDISKMFSPHIANLREAAKKFKLDKTGETSTIRSIPDRGFVGEMSGYLADVCYTDEYPLLKPRPNLIPHKLVTGEGQEAEFFGSYLIFELEEGNGDKVMLVRGFNVPDEASIDVAQFIESTLDKLEATARKRGMTKIVIPGLMGALTNYPLTKNYLYNRYIVAGQSIKLKERFNFNSYDLTEKCFVAREIKQPQPTETAHPPTMPITKKPQQPQTPPPAMS